MADARAFAESMPADYLRSFDEAAIAEHARIVAARGDRPALVSTWEGDRDGGAALCIVADDSPGLFSRISAALVAHDIDVASAMAFCRTRADGRPEAVDFLWIRREAPLSPRDLAAIGEMLEGLVSGRARFDAPRHLARRGSGATRIRFEQVEGGAVVTVEASDRPGLLLAMTKTIFLTRLQIVALHAKSERGRAIDRFHLAPLDGAPLTSERLLELQSAMLEAIDAAQTGEHAAARL